MSLETKLKMEEISSLYINKEEKDFKITLWNEDDPTESKYQNNLLSI